MKREKNNQFFCAQKIRAPNFFGSKKEMQLRLEAIAPDGSIVDAESAPPIIKEYLGAGKEGRQKHIEFMKKHNYLSDKGCPKGSYVFLQKGNFIYEKLLGYLDKKLSALNVEKIRLPHFFCMSGAVSELASKFSDRLVSVEKENKLCYAADPALFSFMQNENLKHVRRIYSPNCFFRKEKAGELKGMMRSAEFVISDLHSFCSNFISEVKSLHAINFSVMDKFCENWFLVFDISEEFYINNKKLIADIVHASGKFALLKIMRGESHYYSMQIQYIAKFSNELFSQIANLQLDFVNGARFGIRINGQPCAIVHASPFGRVEKVIAYLFEQLACNKSSSLQLWLAPEQMRIIPISEKQIDYANKIALKLNQFRAFIDARNNLRLGKRIFEAELEKIPIIIIVGEKEQASESISVRDRIKNKKYEINISEVEKWKI